MSFYLQVDESDPVQIASLHGWGDVIRWAKKLPAKDYAGIHHLCVYGWEEHCYALADQLVNALANHAPSKSDVKSTVANLSDIMNASRKATVVTVTDGLKPTG